MKTTFICPCSRNRSKVFCYGLLVLVWFCVVLYDANMGLLPVQLLGCMNPNGMCSYVEVMLCILKALLYHYITHLEWQ